MIENPSYLNLSDAKEACSNDPECAMFYETTFTKGGFHGFKYFLCRFDAFENPSYSTTGIHTYLKRGK